MTSTPQSDERTILIQALRSVEREWRDLVAEQETLPHHIHQAAQLGHDEQIASLQRRQDELSQRIAGAHLNVLQLRIRLLEIEHRVVQEMQRQIQHGVTGIREMYQVAREQWQEALQVQAAVETRLQQIEQRLSQLQVQLERVRDDVSWSQRTEPE